MSVIAWIVLGLVAGCIASWLTNRGNMRVADVILGIVGAVLGGWLFTKLGEAGVTGLNLYSLMVAVVGSVLLILAFRGFRRAA